MAQKDHDLLQKKRAPTGVKGSPGIEGKAPLPDASVKLQQGTTADMQANVGNSGLKDLLAEQQPSAAKDPSRMGPDELRAQAKSDAQALAKKGKPAKPQAEGTKGAELDEKQKSVLEAEASRKKRDVETATKQKETEAAAHARAKVAERKPAGKGKVDEAKAKKEAPSEKLAATPPGKRAAGVAGQKGEAAAAMAKKTAAERKVDATEAEHQHAATKVEAGRSLVGKGKADLGDRGKSARGKVLATASRAVEATGKAAEAEKKVVETEGRRERPASRAGAAASAVKGPALPTAEKPGAGGQSKPAPGVNGAGKEAKGQDAATATDAKRASEGRRAEKLADERATAEAAVASVKSRKAEVEHEVEKEPEAAKKASLAREAEVAAVAERSADENLKKREEAVDALQAAKENDGTIEQIARGADLDVHDGQEVTLVGIYVPRPAEAGGAQLGHVSVMVGDQEVRLGTDVRGTNEVLKLGGEKVVVTGKLDMKRQPGQSANGGKREKPVLTGFRAPHRR